ncbi:MAG: NADPH-dependent 7-cyano-7-deazaguanine reductase QueF [Pseudomonadales bacterium]|nr:NADPH-dependent 7-cyano-7-deazaguanine reductase QueF [Pseudomonadales bacterium]
MVDDIVMKSYPGLDKKVDYVATYKPSLLVAIPRAEQRRSLGITEDALPFRGMDIWNAYEFTWLNSRGKPEVAQAQFHVPAKSASIIESKSLKLYLGSFANTPFAHRSEVISTLESDLTITAQAPVNVTLMSPEQVVSNALGALTGKSLDMLDVDVDEYYWNPEFLTIEGNMTVNESVFTHLFRSICPITGQPDFASIAIHYNGRHISAEGLLKYLVSYREHAEFCEQIVERIFVDIMNRCSPDRLGVQARFTRRGGLDINPSRSHDKEITGDVRVWRQ